MHTFFKHVVFCIAPPLHVNQRLSILLLINTIIAIIIFFLFIFFSDSVSEYLLQ